MKKVIIVLILAFNLNANAQEVPVEKSIFGIQTGFGVHTGIWFNNESKLSSSIALRSEIGLEKDFTVGDHYDGAGFILQPVLTVEPRYYYNLEKRNVKGKKTANNSGNYVSIKTSYHPDWFVINLADNVTKTADLAIVPTWGLKRQIGNHFTYETALGFGYRVVYLKENSVNGNVQNVDGAYNRNQYIPYLHIGIGYAF
ncbi:MULTISPECIES: hypothetical protein [Flavobacterium]|uniref:Outer membrane protein beta-barrel domain-containing protein n=1 Tax=Flavobacterium ranwuense TaxID=2541725 RepID=A0ABY2DVL1_9FLAO|nr:MULTISPECIES: hypothetical protein [Flavobacterium]TDE31405.1 hypothetical protein E0I61_01525 [Flavobacterium ranwuense]TDE55286.1 hypothetical protein E0H99_02935 [Flavobacterium sp. GT3P67]